MEITEYKSHTVDGETVAKCTKCERNYRIERVGTNQPCLGCEDDADNIRLHELKMERFRMLNGPKNTFAINDWVRI